MDAADAAVPSASPAIAEGRRRFFPYTADATHANAQLEIMFITQPINPVSLIVSISASETAAEIRNAVIGPYKNPPMTIIISFGSYFRNDIMLIGTAFPMITAAYASAQSKAVHVIFFVLFIIATSLSDKKYAPDNSGAYFITC